MVYVGPKIINEEEVPVQGVLFFYPLPRRLILSDVDIIKFGTICHHGRGRFLRGDAIPVDGGGSLGSTCWDLFVVIGDVRSS